MSKKVVKDKLVREYMSEIGSKGGKKSKRVLTPEQSREMTRIRESKRKNKPVKSTPLQ